MMLFIIPLMDLDTYVTSPTSYEKGMGTLGTIMDEYGKDSQEYKDAFEYFVTAHEEITYKLIEVKAPGDMHWAGDNLDSCRHDDYEKIEL